MASLFIAAGHQGQRLASVDGSSWNHLLLGKEGEVYRGLAYGKGAFVAVGGFGGDNLLAATSDGASWLVRRQEARFANYVRGIGFCRDYFLALGGDPGSVGDSKPFTMTSADGNTWTEPFMIAGKNILRRIAFGNDLIVGVGDRGRRAVSRDGKTWTDAPDVKAIDTLIDIAFGNGRFVGVGLNGLRMTSTDGLKWSERLLGDEGEHLNSVIWADNRFVAVGTGATFFSPDGIKWERKDNHDAPLTATFGNGVFVGSNWKGRLMQSGDAVDWKQTLKCDYHVEAVVFGAVS